MRKRILLSLLICAAIAAPVFSQQQFAQLGKHHLPLDLDQTKSLALGDVDGDGDLDLVCENWGRFQERLFPGFKM